MKKVSEILSNRVQILIDLVKCFAAASVIRMFMHAVTEKSFKKGLTYYLNQRYAWHKYFNVQLSLNYHFSNSAFNWTTERELFDALTKSVAEDRTLDASISLNEAFSSWSQQAGYPLLVAERDYGKNTVTLHQRRYLTTKGASDSTKWWIPFNFITAENADFSKTTPLGWLKPSESQLSIPLNASKNDWLLFNKQQTGYYRVLYDKQNYKLLTDQLHANFTMIHRLNRAQLLDDSFDFFEQTLLSFDEFFPLFSYLSHENEYAPWHVANKIVSNLARLLSERQSFAYLRTYIRGIIIKPYNSIGIENQKNEPILRKNTRQIIINLACEHGLAACRNATYIKLKQVLFSNHTLDPNLFGSIYGNGLFEATNDEVSLLWNRLKKTREEERSAILTGFGHIRNESLLREYIQKTIQNNDSSILNKKERNILFKTIVEKSERGLSLGIDLIKRNPLEVTRHLGKLDSLVLTLAVRVTTTDARAKVS